MKTLKDYKQVLDELNINIKIISIYDDCKYEYNDLSGNEKVIIYGLINRILSHSDEMFMGTQVLVSYQVKIDDLSQYEKRVQRNITRVNGILF